MKPSKTAYTTKKKPAKRKNSPMVQKLLELKYRINEAYRGETVIDSNKSDKDFVMERITEVRNGLNMDRNQMEHCNKLWKQYEG